MIFSFSKKYIYLLACALIIAQLGVYFFSPWFHVHPGEAHADMNCDFYHSHTSPFAQPPSESEKDSQYLQEMLHLFIVGHHPFDEMQGFFEANFWNTINQSIFAANVAFYVLSSALISPFTFAIKTIFGFLLSQPLQDYFVLTATDISPPLA